MDRYHPDIQRALEQEGRMQPVWREGIHARFHILREAIQELFEAKKDHRITPKQYEEREDQLEEDFQNWYMRSEITLQERFSLLQLLQAEQFHHQS